MKISKRPSFLLLFVLFLLFCVSCSSKDSRYNSGDDDDFIGGGLNDGETDEDNGDSKIDVDSHDSGFSDQDETLPDDETGGDDSEIDVDSHDSGSSDQDETLPDDDETGGNDSEIDGDSHDSGSSDQDETLPDDETGGDDEIPENDGESPEIICTGLNKCYNAKEIVECPKNGEYFGQDYQFARKGYCLPKNFTVKGETVVDNNSGLIWQRSLPGTYDDCNGGKLCDWQQAKNYCDNLALGGEEDWRLPSVKEYETIIDYKQGSVAIDSSIFLFFNDGQIKQHWTSTPFSTTNNSYMRHIDFKNGVSSYMKKTKLNTVRCVRGDFDEKQNVFETSADEEPVVTDAVANLVWTKNYMKEKKIWKESLKYCSNLEYAGEKGWRLPNVNELKSIVNYAKSAAPFTDFPDFTSFKFWSSTSDALNTYYAWFVDFNNAETNSSSKDSKLFTICVK